MKISNWCILFSVLFCGMILYTDLRFRYTMEAQYTMEEYNRIFDRAADDALTDQLQEEMKRKYRTDFLSRLPMCWI